MRATPDWKGPKIKPRFGLLEAVPARIRDCGIDKQRERNVSIDQQEDINIENSRFWVHVAHQVGMVRPTLSTFVLLHTAGLFWREATSNRQSPFCYIVMFF